MIQTLFGPPPDPGLLERFKTATAKTRASLAGQLDNLMQGRKEIDAELLEDLEMTLIGADIGVPFREAVLREADLERVDELFITSTTREVIPVVRVGDSPIGSGRPGPVAARLLTSFRDRAHTLTAASTDPRMPQ